MIDREQIHKRIENLVLKFETNKYHYLSRDYGEEQVKIEFINPLFEALGWDIRNTQGLSHYEKDVIFEKGETKGYPDYNFRIDGQTKFFIEAKAPHEPMHKINHVLQAKSYAWNTKSVFIVLLTDFEEFRLFDATIKPDPKHPDQGLLYELTYDEYLNNLDMLLTLSKEQVEQGSLDDLIQKHRVPKSLRKPVDESFLEDISQWREELAKDIYKNNIKDLEDTTDEGKTRIQVKILNEAVQKILDRLIFIRIAEDRKTIEPKSLLDEVEWWKAGGKRRNLQKRLTDRFLGWNQDFNGEILKPGPCDVLEIDSHLLAKIIEGLYYPKCPYRFEVIGVELLGSIYERYLGKTIRVTPKRIKIEEKPEVRKAGGVYYTPQYIVNYIVKNTVGKIIKGKTPKQIEKIRILDPACGSGSFLLTAYQILIDYHLQYYEKHPEESGEGKLFPDVITGFNNSKKLSIEKKAHILRNNIFGVDIDPQAVEIAMMSLYLKCMEGEKDLPRKRELLPSLAKNICCGNSLISYDIFEQKILFDEEGKERINPFDWYSKSTGFGTIMEKGGFDIIIGNPPYIRIQVLKEWAAKEVEFYKHKYISASKGNYDIYVVFVERAIKLLNRDGKIGFILPHKFFQANYGEPLRELISEGRYLREIVHFGDQQVFDGPTTYTCLLFLDKRRRQNFRYIKVHNLEGWRTSGEAIKSEIPRNKVLKAEWNFVVRKEAALFEKLCGMNIKLRDVASIFVGLQTSADKVYILEEACPPSNGLVRVRDRDGIEWSLEQNVVKSFLNKVTVSTFNCPVSHHWLIFPYRLVHGEVALLTASELSSIYPRVWEYLKKNEKILRGRESGKADHTKWYGYIYKKNLTLFDAPKLIVQVISKFGRYAYDDVGLYFSGGGNGPYYGTRWHDQNDFHSIHYLQALLSSKLLDFYLHKVSTTFQGGYWSYAKRFIEQLPICIIKHSNTKEKSIHDKIVTDVEKMFELNKKKNNILIGSQKEKIEREILITHEKIDELVYELYRITKEEKKIIEESIKK